MAAAAGGLVAVPRWLVLLAAVPVLLVIAVLWVQHVSLRIH